MIRFFRHFRKQLSSANSSNSPASSVGRYLAYALGEIALVMVGILLALQVNNWNEDRTNRNQLEQILTIVSQDLKTDLANVKEVISFYTELDSLLLNIITNEYPESYFASINEENYTRSIHSTSRISRGKGIDNQERGITLLTRFLDANNPAGEDLAQEISQFYATEVKKMQLSRTLVRSWAADNFKYLEQFPWFKDYIVQKYNPETVRFFANDKTYKNKAASFMVIAVRTHLRDLNLFKQNAEDIVEKIDERYN